MGYGPIETTISIVLLALVVIGSFVYLGSDAGGAASGPPWLGVSGNALSPSIATTLNLKAQHGFLIFTVEPNSPADKAGLRGGNEIVIIDNGGNQGQFMTGGDIITSIDGHEITQTNDVSSIIQSKKIGDTIDIDVIRNNGSHEVLKATLEGRPLGK